MDAIIITIGDEILVGQTVDTNSAHIAKKLNLLGISIKEIVSISDTAPHIKKALDQAKGGREHILGEMDKALKVSRTEFSKHTPKMEIIKVDKKYFRPLEVDSLQGNFSKILDIKLIIENSSRTTGVDHLIKWFTDKWRTPGTIRCMDKVVITTQASATSRRARSSLLVRDTKDISAIRETTGQGLKQPPSTETKNNSVARLHR